VLTQLLQTDPLPQEAIARAAKHASHMRKAREIATDGLLAMFRDSQPDETTG
jgi:hypothetical protein